MKSLFLLTLFLMTFLHGKETITFPSKDKIPITADLYAPHEDLETPFIVLFHRARWSRGEYKGIARDLNKLGFNCLAVDARSGDTLGGTKNETAHAAKAKRKKTEYKHALPDLEAATLYAKEKYAKGQLLIWGSSYSASLVFSVAHDLKEIVNGVVAFSPNFPKWKAESRAARKLTIPIFITSAKDEVKNWEKTFKKLKSPKKTGFIPKGAGNHGSSALWFSEKDQKEYWEAVTKFLTENFIK